MPVSGFVPAGFPAVCRVLHPCIGLDGEPVRWRELADQAESAGFEDGGGTRGELTYAFANSLGLGWSPGELDEITATGLVDVLGRATTTPNDVFVAVWDGWGDVPPQRFPGAASLTTQARGHFLLRGPLTGVLASVAVSFDRPTAGVWWPADRAWFVLTEIDLDWTFVAGDTALIDQLRQHPRLEAVETTFDAPVNRPEVSP
jgi:hypothetical protein